MGRFETKAWGKGGRNVAIIEVGYSKPFKKRTEVSCPELVAEAVDDVLTKAGIEPERIDAYVIGNMQTFEGINNPQLWLSEHARASSKPVMRIATGGTTGATTFICAYYHVASGMCDIVMAIGWEKHSEGDVQIGLAGIVMPEIFCSGQFGPSFRMLAGGGGSTAGSAFQAMDYLARSGAGVEHLDKVTALMRRNAALTPHAHLKIPNCTPEDIAKTPMVSYPLRFGHTCPSSDGACAMILACEEKAKKLCDKPAWIKATTSITMDIGTGYVVEGEIARPAEQRGCKMIAAKAYELAGIEKPWKEIDMIECYDAWAHQCLMWPERLLVVEEGMSPKLLDEGQFEIDGEIPVNPSGGVISTNAIGASAMIRIAEAALQVMEKAGEHQVKKKVRNAVAHGWGGLYQFSTVTVVGESPRRR